MGSSGCAASLPHATRVRNAAKPRHNCAIRSESMSMAGRRTASMWAENERGRMAGQGGTEKNTTGFHPCRHPTNPRVRETAPTQKLTIRKKNQRKKNGEKT